MIHALTPADGYGQSQYFLECPLINQNPERIDDALDRYFQHFRLFERYCAPTSELINLIFLATRYLQIRLEY